MESDEVYFQLPSKKKPKKKQEKKAELRAFLLKEGLSLFTIPFF